MRVPDFFCIKCETRFPSTTSRVALSSEHNDVFDVFLVCIDCYPKIKYLQDAANKLIAEDMLRMKTKCVVCGEDGATNRSKTPSKKINICDSCYDDFAKETALNANNGPTARYMIRDNFPLGRK